RARSFLFLPARTGQHRGQCVIAFITRRLVDLVLAVVLAHEHDFHRPRTRVHVRLVDGDLVFQVIRGRPGQAFDEVHLLVAHTPVGRLVGEFGGIDPEGAAPPVTHRTAQPQTRRGGQVRTTVERNGAIRAAVMACLVIPRDVAGRLHDARDPAESPDAGQGDSATPLEV